MSPLHRVISMMRSGAALGHRYWRLYITDVQGGGGFVGAQEVEFRESISGADATGSGTASANSSFSGLPASQAFDDTSAEWASNGDGVPAFLKYDFGSGVAKDIVEVQITGRTPADQAILGFALQYSDDDSTWTTRFTVLAADTPNWTNGEVRTFNATNAYPTVADQLWRVNVSAVDGGGVVALAELQLRASLGGANAATGGYALASNAAFGAAANAFDADVSNFWAASSTSAWLAYLLPAPVSVAQIAITARNSGGNEAQSPKDFTIQSWDGTAWVTEATVSGSTGWTSGETRTFNI